MHGKKGWVRAQPWPGSAAHGTRQARRLEWFEDPPPPRGLPSLEWD